VGARFFAHVQTGSEAHPASCTMGTGSSPGVNRPGRGADRPPPSSAEVKKEYSYTSTHPLGHFRPVTGRQKKYINPLLWQGVPVVLQSNQLNNNKQSLTQLSLTIILNILQKHVSTLKSHLQAEYKTVYIILCHNVDYISFT
jgi:hypothetical protein